MEKNAAIERSKRQKTSFCGYNDQFWKDSFLSSALTFTLLLGCKIHEMHTDMHGETRVPYYLDAFLPNGTLCVKAWALSLMKMYAWQGSRYNAHSFVCPKYVHLSLLGCGHGFGVEGGYGREFNHILYAAARVYGLCRQRLRLLLWAVCGCEAFSWTSGMIRILFTHSLISLASSGPSQASPLHVPFVRCPA